MTRASLPVCKARANVPERGTRWHSSVRPRVALAVPATWCGLGMYACQVLLSHLGPLLATGHSPSHSHFSVRPHRAKRARFHMYETRACAHCHVPSHVHQGELIPKLLSSP